MMDEMGEDQKRHDEYLQAALIVYGIPSNYVFAWRYDEPTETITIITNGGKKVRHKRGDAANCKLTYVQITGELPTGSSKEGDKFNRNEIAVKTNSKWRQAWEKTKKNIRIF